MTMATALAVLGGGAAVAATAADARSGPARAARVVAVVDGDTVRVRIGGRVGTIDLLGVRAPTGSSCFARRSASDLRRLLPAGARVSVVDETAVGGRGRYVLRSGRLVNASLLRGGSARLGGLTRVSRAGTLRDAERVARQGRRGLHRACGVAAPGAPSPGAPAVTGDAGLGPVPQADAIRSALAGRVLTQLRSDSQSSVRNDTAFCADARAERKEELDQAGGAGGFATTFAGSWAVLDTQALPDGSIAAQVVVRADDPSFDNRVLRLVLGADGRVRSPDFTATDNQPVPGACAPAPGGGAADNDSPAGRAALLAALTGVRLETGGRQTDICPGPTFVRREGGTVVASATAVVEWAISDGTSRLGVLHVADAARRTSRRVLVQIDGASALTVQELGRGDTTGAVAVPRGTASC